MENRASVLLNTFNTKINKNCLPLCVVGCLNRHRKDEERYFCSPAESEVLAALKEAFEIDDSEFASLINQKAFEIGIDSVEFVLSRSLFYKLQNLNPDKKDLLNLVDEIKNLTLTGRIVASRTDGIYNIFKDKRQFKSFVTRSSIEEGENFNILINSKLSAFRGIDDRKYLYALMIVLKNLEGCLFTSFALFESTRMIELMEEAYCIRTGVKIEKEKIIKYALYCLRIEEEYEKAAKIRSTQTKIPEFVKVLHRYFEKSK